MRESLSVALYHAAKKFKDCTYKYYDIGERRSISEKQAWKALTRAEEALFRAMMLPKRLLKR